TLVEREQVEVVVAHLSQDIMTRRQQIVGHPHLIWNIDVVVHLLFDLPLCQDSTDRSRQNHDPGDDSALEILHTSTSCLSLNIPCHLDRRTFTHLNLRIFHPSQGQPVCPTLTGASAALSVHRQPARASN